MSDILLGKKILAIDDTDSIRTFLRILLESNGASFIEANTAQGGLRIAVDEKPDVIILDLGLPDIDGLDILPKIVDKLASTPPIIIILSVRKDNQTKDTAFQRGANGYLCKPFIMDDLISTIEKEL